MNPTAPLKPGDFETLRRQMPVADNWAYLDHAAVAPWPRACHDVFAAWLDDVTANGDVHWPRWSSQLETVRRRGADLMGADPAEIALVRNTTEGVTLVAEGYPWQSGDNVVTLADEFPANVYPWLNLGTRGVETRRVATDFGRFDLSALAAACDSRTRIISVSWVNYATGWRNDLDALAELAHERGALLFVDGIQGLGVFPLDVRQTPIDFLAADGHKWLLSPEGAGYLYVRREHLELLRPLGVGWNSVVQGNNFAHIELNVKPTASRYEGGSQNVGGLLGLGASAELLLALGVENIAARLIDITNRACERLASLGLNVVTPREPGRESGIVSFDWPGADPIAARKACVDAGVVLSCRNGRLRISPHAYNDDGDLERLIEALRRAKSLE